jgi:regulation of enolase protein 1 (concanavalin A-like superfamily)
LVNRRKFIEGSLALTAGAVLFGHAHNAEAAPSPQDNLLSRMTWMNEPASSKIAGEQIVVRSRAKTDFWQKTFDGYVADNGHFYHLSVPGDFTFTACVNGMYATLYDQAGLMVRVDSENWMRCGTEFIDGKRFASVVFTRTYSDGSTMPDLSETEPIWWRIIRKKDSIETLCSLNGVQFTSARMGYFPPSRPVEVGIMCAAPSGPGFEATFKDLKLQTAST